jgi:hypothetical protein
MSAIPDGQTAYSAVSPIQVPAVPGVKHVAQCISISAGFPINHAAEIVQAVLYDGSIPLLQWMFEAPQGMGNPIQLCGLNAVGSAGNTMSLQFIAPGPNGYSFLPQAGSLFLQGYDAK